MEKLVCIHGHFYQPPRENPWLESVEFQESAAPCHDWNERIAAEYYAPNAHARLLDGEGRIERIVNNYARMSFNFGPTLLSWMKEKAPDVHQAIVDADKQARELYSGHGTALAQIGGDAPGRGDSEGNARSGGRPGRAILGVYLIGMFN